MRPARRTRGIVPAIVVGGVFSGVPSTVHAVVTGRSMLQATVAAGTIAGRLGLGRGLLVHVLITSWWTAVLAMTLPRRRTVAWGAAAGLAIGALDLAIADRRYPAIAALPRGAQLADHVVFGGLVASALRISEHDWTRTSGVMLGVVSKPVRETKNPKSKKPKS